MPAPITHLHGRFAQLRIGGVVIATCTEWEVTYETEYEDATAHGDYWKFHEARVNGWTFRATAYVVSASAAHLLAAYWASAADPSSVLIEGFSGTAAGGTKIFEGTGKPNRGNLTAPMALARQEVEFLGYGPPTVGI